MQRELETRQATGYNLISFQRTSRVATPGRLTTKSRGVSNNNRTSAPRKQISTSLPRKVNIPRPLQINVTAFQDTRGKKERSSSQYIQRPFIFKQTTVRNTRSEIKNAKKEKTSGWIITLLQRNSILNSVNQLRRVPRYKPNSKRQEAGRLEAGVKPTSTTNTQ